MKMNKCKVAINRDSPVGNKTYMVQNKIEK